MCTLIPINFGMEMDVRSEPAKVSMGRLKGSRGATDRTISVVDLLQDGSLDQIGHTSNVTSGAFRFHGPSRLVEQRRVISPFDLSSDKATRRI